MAVKVAENVGWPQMGFLRGFSHLPAPTQHTPAAGDFQGKRKSP
jgi:hypothetical protein